MKNLQPNERHLADKLQHVPVPDVDQSWEQMRKLLDREMPKTGGAAWGGNNKWWWMGITVGFIILSTWLVQSLTNSRNIAENKTAENKNVSSTNTNNTSEAKNDKTATLNPDNNIDNQNTSTTDNNDTKSDNNSSNDKQSGITDNQLKNNTTDLNNQKNDASDANDEPATVISERKKTDPVKTRNAGTNINSQKENKNILAGSAQKTSNNTSAIDNKERLNQSSSLNDGKSGTASIKNIISDQQDNLVATNQKSDEKDPANTTQNKTSSEENNIIEASLVNTDLMLHEQSITVATIFNTADNADPAATIVAGKTDRAFLREIRKKGMKEDNRKMSKASMGGKLGGNDRELTFAAGLALPQSIAISGQQASSYNINAQNNRLLDYLPAPYFQYHLNTKLFLQTEFHFQSPQYTERLVLSKSSYTSGSTQFETNRYLEKLYYFNIPFNVYYSPARNFYIGGGLQYSSLLGGVATWEDKRMEGQNVVSYKSVTTRFKDDSMSVSFSPTEWRYQFDANYYFKRFTLGLRFNQAMKDYIDRPAMGSLPPLQQRNRSFLLYLRFNIWEERKKEND